MPDENLKIIYNTFPIKPRQKAVISCQPEQGIFNRFLKVKYWEVYLNKTLISTVDHSCKLIYFDESCCCCCCGCCVVSL